MDYTIFYPTALDEIDPKDDNMDVCVRFSDGRSYTFVRRRTSKPASLPLRRTGRY